MAIAICIGIPLGVIAAWKKNTLLDYSAGAESFQIYNLQASPPIPEPETYALMLAGLGAVGLMARRRRKVWSTALAD